MSFGDLLALVDKTILNPWLTAPCTAAIHFLTQSKFVIVPKDGYIPYELVRPLPPLLLRASILVGIGVLLRVNRALSRKALNNGVNAKFDWSKEIILITGAAGGIGAEAAKKLAARGSTVVVLDVLPLTYPKRMYFRTAIKRRPAWDLYTATEVSVLKQCNYDAVQAVGAQISKTFSVNSLGLLWTAKTFLPSMAQRNHGHFLIIASQTGHLATAGVVDYAATKSAAIAIYEGLQTEMKHTYKAPAVRVSCLSPSAVNTKMFAGIKGPSNFFMPRLTPDGVGETIAQILWSGEAQNLLIPAFAYISPPTRALPEWLRVGMQDGGSQVMTELNPHKPLD